MRTEKVASIKARSAEIQVHAAVPDEDGSRRPGALLIVQGWGAPAFFPPEEAGKLAGALDDAAQRAVQPGPGRGGEGPWTATIDLSDGRRATVGFLGELQEGDRPEVFLSVSTAETSQVTKEIAWLTPEAASVLARELTRAAAP